MIKVSVLYPNTAGHRFDTSYYFDTHIPMVREKLGTAVKGISVEQGLAGGAPGSPAAYAMMFHLLFDSVDAFQQAFGPHAAAITGDIANYTDLQPTIQISAVKM
jgi:uncharacterized protein (TIGR02118 family)